MKIVLLVLLTVAAFVISVAFAGWKIRRACKFILKDLRTQRAFDPASAVPLPYGKTSLFRIGMRDYRPRALTELVKHDIVRLAEGERYYLREGEKLTAIEEGAAGAS
jgi:hypothetical protein